MTLRTTSVVDWLGLEKDTEHVVLTLVDDDDWQHENEHLSLLQEKLNSYLAFIEGGEVFARLESDVGRSVPRTTPIRVSIIAKHPVPARAKEFLKYAQRMFAEAGFNLTHEVLEVSPEWPQ
jgi:hypothetical protein